MFRFVNIDHLVERFGAQFEPNDGGYLYRKGLREAPMQVSASERDAFLAKFVRECRRLIWLSVGLAMAGIVTVVTAYSAAERELPEWAIFALVAVIVLVLLIGTIRLWNAPARSLQRRPELGVRRTRAEVRRRYLTQMSWGEMATLAGAGAVGYVSQAWGHDIWTGWGRLWLVGGALFVLLFVNQAISKFRFDRSDGS